MKNLILLLLIAIEIFLTSNFRKVIPIEEFTNLSLLIISFIIGFMAIFYSYPKDSTNKISSSAKSNSFLTTFFLINSIGIIALAVVSNKVFQTFPISMYNASFSDIIPQQIIMIKRFLLGESPYQLITIWEHHLFPTYLTMHWLPYSFAEILKFDYRWVPFGIYSISTFYFQYRLSKSKMNFYLKILYSTLPWIALYVYIIGLPIVYANTSETMIAGYYLFLVLAIFSKNNCLKAASILVCILSRYSLILWIPLYFLSVYKSNKKDAFKVSTIVIIGILILYVIPFMSIDPAVFLKSFEYHGGAAKQVWQQVDGSKTYVLTTGLGMGSLFFDYWPGTILERLRALQLANYIGVCITMVVLVLLFLKNKSTINQNLYILGGLKIYMCIFLSFIHLPFDYLFFVPLVISWVIVLEINNFSNKTSDKFT